MKPILLCILDGVGIRKESYGNAFKQANTPNFDMLFNTYPHSLLEASGEAVGLPEGQMGNSEVGHLNIGAGRVVYQPLQFITKQIVEETFYENESLKSVIAHVKTNHSRLQIFGLLSDGGIHSHINHLLALLEMCEREGVEQVYLHLFTDGRDTLTNSAERYFEQLKEKIKETNLGVIATISGRYYAMDRDNRYDRVEKAYDAIVNGKGENYKTYHEVLAHNYEKGITDEFIVPAVLDTEGCVKENDGLIVFNYRPDRLRELFSALTNSKFKGFKRKQIKNLKLVTMMPVSDEVVSTPAFEPEKLDNTLGEYISENGISQLRIAETEKYAHVTYFFDGGVEKELKNCDRILIPSPKVATYDLSPGMSAKEITDTLLEKLEEEHYEVIILNYANGDMLGHTGNLEATIESIEIMDHCLGKLYHKIQEKNGTLVVTADHGNCEIMLDQDGNKVTSHTTNLVPFIVTNPEISLKNGKLSDIAPTILSLLNIPIPSEMTGVSLIQEKTRKNYDKWFVMISAILLCIIGCAYGYRLIHYYRMEHPKVTVADTSLYGKIMKEEIQVTSGDGLYRSANGYYYKGKEVNNYVYYSNRYFRIVKINEDHSMMLITDDLETSMVWNHGDNDYKTSSIRNWLNDNELEHTGIFYSSLSNPDLYLKPFEYCVDTVTLENITCKKKVSDKVGLLSIEDYKNAGANLSYLNIGKYWWTSNSDLEDGVWYVFDEGGINSKSKEGTTYYSYGVRPVITLKADVNYISGSGTKEDPYRIEPETKLGVGSYITYSDTLWRIISISEDSYQLLKEESIMMNGEHVKRVYSTTSSSFNPSDYTSLAYYLNTTYLKTLDPKLLVSHKWNIGEYSEQNSYNYKNLYSSTVEAKVALPKITDLFQTGSTHVTITPSSENMIYKVQENGSLYVEDILKEVEIRPVISISKQFNYTGNGTKESPFVIG